METRNPAAVHMSATYKSCRPSRSKSIQLTLIPAPTSSTPASFATSVNVPSLLFRSLIVGVQTKINVHPTVAVVIRDRRARKRSLRRSGKMKCIWPQAEFSASHIQKQQWPARPYNNQVLPAVVINVGKQRARRVSKKPHSRRFRDVLERPVSAVPVKPVGKPRRLANIQVVESVAINVANRHAVVPVNINPARTVHHRAPSINAWHKLRAVRSTTREDARRNILEHRSQGPAPCFLHVPPFSQPYLHTRPDLPIQLHASNPLLAMKSQTLANKLVTHTRVHFHPPFLTGREFCA